MARWRNQNGFGNGLEGLQAWQEQRNCAGRFDRYPGNGFRADEPSRLHGTGRDESRQPGSDLNGCVVASDGFFPFPDGIEKLAAAGARAIIAPGGSIRDDEVAAAAEKLGVTLILTGRRHFNH